ncbi:ribokinase [Ornithinimicrobium faecis]|uniref:ribokinase n=1 Tax=Ornithinimicrobium faecis TaxID=2934158 RepID=UPI00211800CB|nr:ribokinase [Ornithinimicrobium sp. HY1745]
MILVVGSYGAGIAVRVPRVPEGGETIADSTLNIGHGGKSSNQAVAAARQGASVSLLTALGDDAFAESARTLWDEEGIDHSAVKASSGSTMAGVIIVEPSGENRIAIAPGVLDDLTPDDLEQHRSLFAAADLVVICLEVPTPVVERAITLAKENDSTVILNPAPATSLSHEVIAQVDYFVPNQSEHEFYVREGYQALPTQTVVLTQGVDGATITTGDGTETLAPLPQPQVVDTTGAGDTFVGTFAAALDAGEDLRPAVQRAIVASSLAVTVAEVIPSIPGRAAVDDALTNYLHTN